MLLMTLNNSKISLLDAPVYSFEFHLETVEDLNEKKKH